MQQTLSIVTPGHEDRYSGGTIEIEWPSMSNKEFYNKGFHGNYLVKSVTHFFTNYEPIYQQKMILIKNAYEDSDKEKNLLKAQKKNLKG